MLSLLGAEFSPQMIIFFVLIIGMLIFMFIFPNMSRKKQYEKLQVFLDKLKIGDKVKTTSGFYGTIISFRETTDGKVALLEMGEGNKKGYITVDVQAIYAIDEKEDVVRDADGNIIEKDSKAENNVENNEKTTEVKEDLENISKEEKEKSKKNSKTKNKKNNSNIKKDEDSEQNIENNIAEEQKQEVELKKEEIK